MKRRIGSLMESAGVPLWGVCSYESLPSLLECRAKARLPQSPASVLVCLFPYYVGDYPQRNVSRYALPDDYHSIAGEMLEAVTVALMDLWPREQWAFFIDSSPIPERVAARLAGLGIIGRNQQFINPAFGSYVFIGCVVTSLAIRPDSPVNGDCMGCGQCLSACPTGSLDETGFHKELCLSHITQKKGELTPWEQEQVIQGGLIWGCDRCQDVCPHNHSPRLTPIGAFRESATPRVTRESIPLLMSCKAYGWRGPSVILRNIQLVGPQNT